MLRLTLALLLLALGTSQALAQPTKKTEIKADGWGSLTGKVRYVGMNPAPLVANPIANIPAAAVAANQPWVIDPMTGGVANVFVYLKAPKDTYFPLRENDKTSKKKIELDTPNKYFSPRNIAYYPVYFDGKKNVETGEELFLVNSSKKLTQCEIHGSSKI